MNTNEKLIERFYTCFARKDFKGMQDCYADNAIFNDPIFKNLNSTQVKDMWEMLLTRSKDIRIEFADISANENTGTAHWDAYYTFSATGNSVINKIDASFEFENGKIVKHTDSFSFYSWAKQALGLPGLLLGWTNYLQQKVAVNAMKNLQKFESTRT